MRKIHIKTFIVLTFLSLYIGQGAFCGELNVSSSNGETRRLASGIDILKAKPFFEKVKNKKQNKQKTLRVEETPLDTSTFSMFEDDGEMFDLDGNSGTSKNKKVKKKKEKTKKNFLSIFKKNKKNKLESKELDQEQNKDEIIPEEITKDEVVGEQSSQEIKDETYINDTDIVYIQEVEIFGNNLLDVNYIKEQINSKAGSQYIRSEVSNDLRALYNTGYFTQNLRALPIKIDNNNVKLRIILEENPPVEGFGVIGNNSISTNEILYILNRYKGKPQNILSINDAIFEIQELYSSRGYILARVDDVKGEPDGYVEFVINEGIIGDIIVEGNNKTKDFIVKRNIFLQPGSVYNENTMRSDILRLMGTSAFKDVQRELIKDEQTGLYDVQISLDEQRTGRISLGVGIDSASGFFGSVGFAENNFRGLGQKLNLNLLAGTGVLMNDSSIVEKANFQGELSFLEPMFKRENQSLALRGFARYYGSYQVPLAIEKRFGAEATIARRFTTYKNLSGSIGFGVESVHLSEGDATKIRAKYQEAGFDWSNRKKELDDGFYVKITPALVYDTRDSIMNPRNGVLARVMLEENLALSGNTFGKLHGMIRRYAPVGKKSSLVFTARAGGKLHGDMPDFAGFALGGPYTIRGFNISEVGVGDGYMLGSAEYRVPIPFIDRLTSNTFLNNLRIAAFVDGGTLFGDTIGSKVYNKPGYAITAGIGLRIFIPGLGPINLDYGLPLTATKGADRDNGFFTFGMGEMY